MNSGAGIRIFLIKFKGILLLFLLNPTLHMQANCQAPKALVSPLYGAFYHGIDNAFSVVAQQVSPVTLGQLSATFKEYETEKQKIEIEEGIGGYFFIHPPAVGWVEISVALSDTVEIKKIYVKPLEVVGRLGSFKAHADGKIPASLLKAQIGIIASIECCGFDASCDVLGFEIIRIDTRNNTERKINSGRKFQHGAAALIAKAQSGDIYIFRAIRYKCPGEETAKRLEDMVFEVE